jgi:ubiquinone/menaquinone biosynthesis C-methylase UbiE
MANHVTYNQDYFSNRKYHAKEQLVKRHVWEVLQWASKAAGNDLLDGQGKRALDVGSAFGYTSRALSELGYETFGADISSWGTKQAKQLSKGEFLVCDAQTNMPFNEETFDLVTAFDVLEHLSHPEKALQSMFAVSKGAIVCTTPNRKVEKSVRSLTRDFDPTHINVKTPQQWRTIATSNLAYGGLWVETFFDFPLRFRGKLFFKSFRIPTYGLTVRIAVKK